MTDSDSPPLKMRKMSHDSSSALPASFPGKLYQLLEYAEEKDLGHVISWTDGGNAFRVHDPEAFEATLLTKFFTTTKYTSLTRQFCAYGFSCVRKGRQTGMYYHPEFNRADPNACLNITRKAMKTVTKPSIKKSTKASGSLQAYVNRIASVAMPSFLSPEEINLVSDNEDVEFDEIDELSGGCVFSERNETPPLQAVYRDYPSSSLNLANMEDSIALHQMNTDLLTRENDQSLEPIPLSEAPGWTNHVFEQNKIYPAVSSFPSDVWEPRSIQEMFINPRSYENLYNFFPTMSEQTQTILEFMSPVMLPSIFYFSELSKFGMLWCAILLCGHTLEVWQTNFSHSHKQESASSSTFGVLQHLMMDTVWNHSLISAMLLKPEYFGPKAVMVAALIVIPQPLYLAGSWKLHFQRNVVDSIDSKKTGQNKDLAPKLMQSVGKVFLNIFSYYMVATGMVLLADYISSSNLMVLGVFLLNLAPVITEKGYKTEFEKGIKKVV